MPGKKGTSVGSVAAILRDRRGDFTPAELRVAQTLLGNYPAAGLQSVARLAASAEVSAPTVVRLVVKLGFAGYPSFQDALRSELSARRSGKATRPLAPAHGVRPSKATDSLLRRSEEGLNRALADSLSGLDAVEVDRAVELLTTGRRLLITGGRLSGGSAQYLASFLSLLRPGVELLGESVGERSSALLDIDRDCVIVVFDYPRYQRDTIRFGRDAAGRGARLILLTDNAMSPLSTEASVLLTTVADTLMPLVSLTPVTAVVETLVVGLIERGGRAARDRIAGYEDISSDLLMGDELFP